VLPNLRVPVAVGTDVGDGRRVSVIGAADDNDVITTGDLACDPQGEIVRLASGADQKEHLERIGE
jgi:hypothetical protein